MTDNFTDSVAEKVIFCSGKVGFDIKAKLDKAGLSNIKVIKVEEIAPFPVSAIRKELQGELDSGNTEFTWVQEESLN